MAREKRRKTAADANLSPLFGLPLNDWNPLFGNTDPEATVQQEGAGSSSSTDVVPPQPGSSSSSGQPANPEEEPEPAPNPALPRRQ